MNRSEEMAARTLDDMGIRQIPVNPEAIAEKLGLSLKYEYFQDDLSGVLMRRNGRAIIAVNANDPVSRRRFTIAHELGHYVLEHQGDVFVDRTILRRDARSSNAVDRQEIEANAFAAALLMPEEQVIRHANRILDMGHLDPQDIPNRLAKMFLVSEQAMRYRMTGLGLFSSPD